MILTNAKVSLLKTNKSNYTFLLAKFLLLIFLTVWILGLLHPILWSVSNPIISFSIDRIYSGVCHQQDYKCIVIGENKMLVCARCTGIYFGALCTLVYMFFKRIPNLKISVLLLAALPLFADVLFTNLKLYHYSQPIAFATGLIFGSTVCLFLLSELINFSLNKSIKRDE